MGSVTVTPAPDATDVEGTVVVGLFVTFAVMALVTIVPIPIAVGIPMFWVVPINWYGVIRYETPAWKRAVLM